MITFAHAKINLGLYVTAKRSDGYHNIESIFLPVSLNDVLEIVPTDRDGISLIVEGISPEIVPGNNLVERAYYLLAERYAIGGVKSCLIKNIPAGAGLGGGSSDATHMLHLLNGQFSLGLDSNTLMDLAAQLGSDCPFFVQNRAMYVSGRGEVLSSVSLSLTGTHVVIVHPRVHVSTADAYLGIVPQASNFDLRKIHELPQDVWQDVIRNDFEPNVIYRHPVIGEIKNTLIEMGAFYASMSGSGSSVFGLFHVHPILPKQFKDYFTRVVQVM